MNLLFLGHLHCTDHFRLRDRLQGIVTARRQPSRALEQCVGHFWICSETHEIRIFAGWRNNLAQGGVVNYLYAKPTWRISVVQLVYRRPELVWNWLLISLRNAEKEGIIVEIVYTRVIRTFLVCCKERGG